MVVGLSPPCGPELAVRTERKVCFPPLAPPGWAAELAGDSGCCDPGLRPVGGVLSLTFFQSHRGRKSA